MRRSNLEINNLLPKLDPISSLVISYLISNITVQVITPKMVSRILKRSHSIVIQSEEAEFILFDLSNGDKAILKKCLYFMNKEIKDADYLEMNDNQKSLISCQYHPNTNLNNLRKDANKRH